MDKQYLYILINLLVISVPLSRSFENKVAMYKKFGPIFKSIALMAGLFLAWDIWFTHLGVWGFNDLYNPNFKLFGLPPGEIMFFITVPYTCLFVYLVLNYFIKKDFFRDSKRIITIVLAVFTLLVALFNVDKAYTFSAFLLCSILLFLQYFVIKGWYMGRFFLMYLVICIPFTLTNGVMTGLFIEQEIVWYNNNENLGIRFLTIPLDDFAYNLAMLLLTVSLFEYFRKDTFIEVRDVGSYQ
ncbi:MAG: lycopene cyclase domain-containing protein [Luteibaculaceae bacterium]